MTRPAAPVIVALFAIAACLTGCHPIVIPDTPEAMACIHVCIHERNECLGGWDSISNPLNRKCTSDQYQCDLRCPGVEKAKLSHPNDRR
jgi:hypothetical protein